MFDFPWTPTPVLWWALPLASALLLSLCGGWLGVRLLRDNVVIHEGTLKTLKRFKDEVKEVQSGQECGMAFENYDDVRKGDIIEIFEREEVERNLD